MPIEPDGSLGKATQVIQHRGASINKGRQAGPHVHSMFFAPDLRTVFTCDLGVDQLVAYRYNSLAPEP